VLLRKSRLVPSSCYKSPDRNMTATDPRDLNTGLVANTFINNFTLGVDDRTTVTTNPYYHCNPNDRWCVMPLVPEELYNSTNYSTMQLTWVLYVSMGGDTDRPSNRERRLRSLLRRYRRCYHGCLPLEVSEGARLGVNTGCTVANIAQHRQTTSEPGPWAAFRIRETRW
jgi:hypothetical protein